MKSKCATPTRVLHSTHSPAATGITEPEETIMKTKKITRREIAQAMRVFAARDRFSADEIANAVRIVEAADAQGGVR